jgi:hypothetical protein
MSGEAGSGPEDFAVMAAPGEEHARLKAFVGTFDAEVKVWMGAGEPHVSTGTMLNELELGGRFLKQTYEGDPADGPLPEFSGRGYWGYNKTDGRWEGFWIDNASTMMQVEHGQLDDAGEVWTMSGEMTDPGSGNPIAKRSVITLDDDDHHSVEMYFETPAGEAKGMEIHYSRKV